jgi:hypothetical protein
MRRSLFGRLFLLAVIGLLWFNLASTLSAGDRWCPGDSAATCVQTQACADVTHGHSACQWSDSVSSCGCNFTVDPTGSVR